MFKSDNSDKYLPVIDFYQQENALFRLP